MSSPFGEHLPACNKDKNSAGNPRSESLTLTASLVKGKPVVMQASLPIPEIQGISGDSGVIAGGTYDRLGRMLGKNNRRHY
jgi:hypothetical protein